MPLIHLEGVTKVYDSAEMSFFPQLAPLWQKVRAGNFKDWKSDGLKVVAIRGISCEIQKGEFLALAGPSGSGKSTLMNLIGGLDYPTQGKIFYGGMEISQMSENDLCNWRLQYVGFIFQAYNLIPVLSALENVEYPMVLQGIPMVERTRRALEALRAVGLADFASRRPNLLSGGQQQRVAIARAVAHRPSLILADEPTSNIDSKTAGEVMDLMVKLNEEHEITFVFSSHDPLVLSRARRVLNLRDGQLAELEPVQ